MWVIASDEVGRPIQVGLLSFYLWSFDRPLVTAKAEIAKDMWSVLFWKEHLGGRDWDNGFPGSFRTEWHPIPGRPNELWFVRPADPPGTGLERAVVVARVRWIGGRVFSTYRVIRLPMDLSEARGLFRFRMSAVSPSGHLLLPGLRVLPDDALTVQEDWLLGEGFQGALSSGKVEIPIVDFALVTGISSTAKGFAALAPVVANTGWRSGFMVGRAEGDWTVWVVVDRPGSSLGELVLLNIRTKRWVILASGIDPVHITMPSRLRWTCLAEKLTGRGRSLKAGILGVAGTVNPSAAASFTTEIEGNFGALYGAANVSENRWVIATDSGIVVLEGSRKSAYGVVMPISPLCVLEDFMVVGSRDDWTVVPNRPVCVWDLPRMKEPLLNVRASQKTACLQVATGGKEEAAFWIFPAARRVRLRWRFEQERAQFAAGEELCAFLTDNGLGGVVRFYNRSGNEAGSVRLPDNVRTDQVRIFPALRNLFLAVARGERDGAVRAYAIDLDRRTVRNFVLPSAPWPLEFHEHRAENGEARIVVGTRRRPAPPVGEIVASGDAVFFRSITSQEEDWGDI